MSYRVLDRVEGFIGGTFQNRAEAQAVIEEILHEGQDNEVNWLLELVHATEEGGLVNINDQGYVHRIITAEKDVQRDVAIQCAIERIYADYDIVTSMDE